MARRDTYHDHATAQEICESGRTADGYLQGMTQRLVGISGANNVTSAVVTSYDDPSAMVYHMRVSFDSRAWTGR